MAFEIIGADRVEVSPPLDPSGVTALTGRRFCLSFASWPVQRQYLLDRRQPQRIAFRGPGAKKNPNGLYFTSNCRYGRTPRSDSGMMCPAVMQLISFTSLPGVISTKSIPTIWPFLVRPLIRSMAWR